MYNANIINKGYKMFKKVIIMLNVTYDTYLYLQDVYSQTSQHLKVVNNKVWADKSSADDVDMSDLDETLTESEMMMTEEGAGNEMERIAFPASEYYSFARE